MDESTIDSARSMAGKRGRLDGAVIEDADVLASTDSVFQSSRPGGGARGLQQFFSPPEAAQLATAVLHLRSQVVCDLTAGNGALLAGVPQAWRFGIEIDADQVRAGRYTAIRGDLQQVYPLLRAAGVSFPRLVLNPPFGLSWIDPLRGGKRVNSMVLAFRCALDVLDEHGVGMMIAGRDRFDALILGGEHERAIRMILDVNGLFGDVDLPCVIAFFCKPENATGELSRQSYAREQLAESDVQDTIRQVVHDSVARVDYLSPVGTNQRRGELVTQFKAIQGEYDRRVEGRGLQQPYDILAKDGRLSVRPSPFARLALNAHSKEARVMVAQLDRQSVSYFALNLGDWNRIETHVRAGRLTIDPQAKTEIECRIASGRLVLRPMYPLPVQMRLGFLDEFDRIRCRTSDPEQGFVVGEWYPVKVESKVVTSSLQRLVELKPGEPEVRRFERERKLLDVVIDGKHIDESPDNIKYLVEHFDLPEPGDIATNHPQELERARSVLLAIAAENGITLDDWQVDDLSRCVVKERALMAWSQGGGKTLAQLYFVEACIRLGKATNHALFIAPQDLHPQWQRECKKFLGSTGRELQIVQTPADADRVRKHIARGGEGWFITHYEALSLIGTSKDAVLPVVKVYVGGGSDRAYSRAQEVAAQIRAAAEAEYNAALARWDESGDPPEPPSIPDGPRNPATSEVLCPACPRRGESTIIGHGWNGRTCAKCGYAHYARRVKPVASRLASTFRTGVICVDELTMVRGNTAKRSLALRGMRSACRLGASGTPISNYVNDCFWGLAWCIGWGSERFPYDYGGGKAKFEKDFCVIEYLMGRKEDREEAVRKRRKVMPEVTNLSMLWKLLSINMVRRRQRDMGAMVKRTFHTIEVPMGVAQRPLNEQWLQTFPAFFTHKHPDHPVVKARMVQRFQATLGLLWKMEYAATLPEQDPDREWHGLDVSNFTPKLVKALEIIEERVAAGEKVLVGSCLVEMGPLICELLTQRGIKAKHITERRGGKATTMNPRARAKEVTDFITGDTSVLAAGVQAMKLGHNLEIASTVVLIGFPWSYEAFDQFLTRVWRLTSTRPVSVYCLSVTGSLDIRKFKLLVDKGAASDLALDGQLIDEPEEPVNWDRILQEMQSAGVPVIGNEVDEDGLEQHWRTTGSRRSIVPSVELVGIGYGPEAEPGEQMTLFA